MQLLNNQWTYLLSTERAEEMAQLRKHSPDTLGEIPSNHHRHQPLNPYMIVVTLEPGDFSRFNIDSLTYIRTITIREHHDVFEPLECLLLLDTIKAEVGMWLEPILSTAVRRLHV